MAVDMFDTAGTLAPFNPNRRAAKGHVGRAGTKRQRHRRTNATATAKCLCAVPCLQPHSHHLHRLLPQGSLLRSPDVPGAARVAMPPAPAALCHPARPHPPRTVAPAAAARTEAEHGVGRGVELSGHLAAACGESPFATLGRKPRRPAHVTVGLILTACAWDELAGASSQSRSGSRSTAVLAAPAAPPQAPGCELAVPSPAGPLASLAPQLVSIAACGHHTITATLALCSTLIARQYASLRVPAAP